MSKLLVKHGSNNEEAKNCSVIVLNTGQLVIVDNYLYEELNQYHWKAKKSAHCTYAIRKVAVNGKEIEIKMHRQIMNTPKGEETHHINSDTLDNRVCNLVNCSPSAHRQLHRKAK